ncbi:MAG TPA: putative LPS assembly protein LptD, partial [Pyrinomonadaceae bacterium]|nr:putative LPS assembly protein LptD [Pyrinomonadaceae bacterium]
MRIAFRSTLLSLLVSFALACVAVCLLSSTTLAQQTNPVDRKVTNPMTDTPNINPLTQDQPIRPRPQPGQGGVADSTDVLKVDAGTQTVSGPEAGRVFVYEGNVDARIGTYRLQADKVTVYEATNKVLAEGNVVFDQGEQQRITGSRAEWNYRTKTGYFIDSTGFTNQTQDGTRIYFTADKVEKISLDTIVVTNGQITACEEDVPKWSFNAKRARIKTGDRVRVYSPSLRVKGVPVFYLPYASVSIKQRDRASGFLTPTFGGSGQKGFRLSNAYYQTLGRSADVTLRNDIYSKRGLGFGA